MKEPHRKMVALWVAVGGIMTLVIVLWALLLPMQLHGGTLTGASEASRWNVYRPQAEEVSGKWEDAMEEWRTIFSRSSVQTEVENRPAVSEADILKLKAKIEAASSRTDSSTTPKP